MELVYKETWTDAGRNFMALRQTILNTVLSSPRSILSQRETAIDIRDPILRLTGIDSVLMDIALHQLLLHSPQRRRLVGKSAFLSQTNFISSQYFTIHTTTWLRHRC